MTKILVMGLPGSGKTTLSQKLKQQLEQHNKSVEWFNADTVREQYNDWDFSNEGRLRQAHRMAKLAQESTCDYVICDFIAPIQEYRDVYNADIVIWMDTIDSGRYEDTNTLFEQPDEYDFRVSKFDSDSVSQYVASRLVDNYCKKHFDSKKETVQMLGRWQPWHAGHRALFERAIAKTGQVCIMIRDCCGWNDSNPFDVRTVERNIRRDLDLHYKGMYTIMVVPNVVNITYGRDVGYKIEQEVFDETIHNISATKIRKSMGLK